MDFSLTEEQRSLAVAIAAFARDELSPDRGDAGQGFRRDAWQRCADAGVLGWAVPAEYGGEGFDPLTLAVAFEALGYGCRDNGLVFAVNNHVWACLVYLLEHGTERQRGRWLPGLRDGSTIGAHALTELESGSDVLSLSTKAARTPEGYRLTGTKSFISNAPCADLFVAFARTSDAGPAQRALSAFLVPRDTPGLSVRELDKMGLHGCPMGVVEFDDCPLPAEALLGREGAGYQVFSSTIEWERGFMFAGQVGVLRRLLEDCVGHAAGRRQFGRPLGARQGVAHPLADLRVKVELAQLLLYKIGWLKSQGRTAVLEASMLKLFVSEALVGAATEAVRLHGARGYVSEYGIEHELRDAVATTIYGGASEIQRTIIAALSGLPHSGQ